MMKITTEQRAVELVFSVKERFVNQPFKFNEFVNILSELRGVNSMKDRDLLVSNLKNLFVDDHEDLLVALNDFLPKTLMFEKEDDLKCDDVFEKEDDLKCGDDDDKHSWLLIDSSNEFFNKLRDRCIKKNDKEFSVLIKFCELIVSCHDKRITAKQADLEFRVLFKDDVDLYVECTRFLADLWEEESNEESGLDYSGVGFLNKRRKVVRRRSLYDETMAVKEFYLYEMELALVRIETTIMKLDGDPETFGKCFTVHDSKCIVELYKGCDSDYSFGEEMLKILQCDPDGRILARGVVQERLRQKMMQLKEQKLRLDPLWREIFEDIREKGVVCRHRGFLEQMAEWSKTNYCGSD